MHINRFIKNQTYNNTTVRLLIYSQLIMLIAIVVSIALMVQGLSDNSGFSYYGVHARTILPYITGMTFSAYFLLKAGLSLENGPRLKIVKTVLYLSAALMIAVMLTPYSINLFFNDLHSDIGVALFGMQFIFAIYLLIAFERRVSEYLIFALLLGVGLVALLAQITILKILIEAQVAFQLVYYVLFIRILARRLARVSGK